LKPLLINYIQQDNPDVARKVAQMVIDRIEQLATSPGTGRPGEVKGTRELVVSPYVVVYRYTDEIVEILYIWHRAQDWR
jgi:addiction module RelE/StbE family toxin